MYGAALYRLRAEDFGELRHHDGISPAWPISYDEMEPYYTRAEQLYQVHGARGEDPTEPWTSAPYPYPAVSHEPRIQQLSDDLARAGLQPVPRAVRDPAQRGEHGLQRVRALWHLRRLPVPGAREVRRRGARRPAGPGATRTWSCCATPRRSGWRPTRPAPRSPRSWSTTRAIWSGTTADIVVVACGAANSAKLLLASANDRHPSGLANGSDEVGRNYMFHDSQAVLALSREPNPTVFQKTLGVNDFYLRGPGLRLPDGQHPDDRQVAGRDVPRREAVGDQARPDLGAARRGRPRGRLLAVHGGPSRGRTTGSRWTATATSGSSTRRATRPRPSASTTSSSRCWATSACTPIT